MLAQQSKVDPGLAPFLGLGTSRGFRRQDIKASGRSSEPLSRANSLLCQASTSLAQEAYSIPNYAKDFREPLTLEVAVRSAIGHLPEAPFLQLHQHQVTTHHAIDDSILQSSQLREGLNQFFRESSAEMVMLVHPLSSPEANQSARKVDADGNVMTGISNARRRNGLESFSDFLRRGGVGAKAVLSGSIGDCCEEAGEKGSTVSQVVAFPRKKYAKYEHGQHSSGPYQSRNEVTRFFGMILQSRRRGDSGCYVLKTMDSAVGDCTCTHWTLTRVSKDAPIFDQLCSAWLLH